MPTEAILAKLERAETHIADFEVTSRSFCQSGAYKIVSKVDDRGRCVVYLESMKPLPKSIVAVIGDALHNTRAALEYIAWDLVVAAGQTPTTRTSFPISDDAKKFESEYPRKVEGMSDAAVVAIQSLKPYKAGNLALWQLNRLENIDKHRTLVTAGHRVMGQTLPFSAQKGLREAFLKRMLPGEPIPDYENLVGRPHIPNSRLKNGDELMSFPVEEGHDNLHFAFDIAFAELGICDGEPVAETLHHFANLVRNIAAVFEPMLS